MNAIVTAGGIPQPGEPLYPITQGKAKALLELSGKPMVQWVLDALCAAQKIENVVLIGLDSDSGVSCSKPLYFLPNENDMVKNLKAGVRKLREELGEVKQILAVSSDIPAITSEMVDWLVDIVSQTDEEVYYCVIPREVMEARYPGSKRSYTRLKDMEVCGGDMNAFDARIIDLDGGIWDRLTEARKSAMKQAALIGYDTLFLLLIRQLSMESAARRVTQRLKVTGRAIVCPYAEIGMDVDKPHQLEMVRNDIAKKPR
jgi:GTP:adenosylcobinamide-phosphate guanylyltransferase